jgi:SAM-dependent methyltransferase
MFYWMTDAQQREFSTALQTITRIYPRFFAMDMLVTVGRNMGFLEDADFMRAVNEEARSDQERSLIWRLHVLCWCGQNALRLAGDFVECGVFQGFSTAVVARYLRFQDQRRSWYLYDTFSGIPADQRNAGSTGPDVVFPADLYESVQRRFAAYPNVRVVRGRIPEILSEAAPVSIAFMHLDLNSAPAELGALQRLYDRLVPGGYLVLDDYGWYPYRQQKAEEDPFFQARGTRVLELPTGQGLVIKPPA